MLHEVQQAYIFAFTFIILTILTKYKFFCNIRYHIHFLTDEDVAPEAVAAVRFSLACLDKADNGR